MGLAPREQFERALAVGGELDAIVLQAQRTADRLADGGLVVDYEDGHGFGHRMQITTAM